MSCEERLGELDLFSLEQRLFWGGPTTAPSDQGEVIKELELELSSSEQYIEEQETVSRKRRNRVSGWRNFLPLRTVEH